MLGIAAPGRPLGEAKPECIERQFRHGKGRVLVLRGRVTEHATGDVGERYFRSYRPEPRAEIDALAEFLGLGCTTPGLSDGLIGVFPVLQPSVERVVVHVVNYDVDYASDAIRAKTGVAIGVPRSGIPPGTGVVRVYAPGEPVLTVPAGSVAGRLSFTLPHLGVTADVVLSAR